MPAVATSPRAFGDLALWLDAADANSFTKAYQNITPTGSGTSGTTTITASATVAKLVPPGSKLRIGGTDIYTVDSVSTTTITTVETLSATYNAGSALAVDKISQWNDKSGNARHATQGTVANQPVYVPAAQNGQSVVDFIGDADAVGIPSLALQTSFTQIVVLRLNISMAAGSSIRDVLGKANNNANLFIRQATSVVEQKCVLTGGADPRSALNYASYDAGAYGVIISEVNLSNRTIYLPDGTSNTASNTPAASLQGATDTWLLGRTNTGNANYRVVEALFYNHSLSSTERARLISYLQHKWRLL